MQHGVTVRADRHRSGCLLSGRFESQPFRVLSILTVMPASGFGVGACVGSVNDVREQIDCTESIRSNRGCEILPRHTASAIGGCLPMGS